MSSVELSAENVEPPSWLPDVDRVVSAVCERLGVDSYSISVLLCSEGRIRELNRAYRNREEATDVLTFSRNDGERFPGEEPAMVAGDIVIAPTMVESNAREYGVERSEECVRVFVHSLLHLCGHTHNGVKMGEVGWESDPMLVLQEELVRDLAKERMF